MEWDDATSPRLPNVPVPMQQHLAYAGVCVALGQRVRWLRIGPEHAPVATALALCRRWPGLGNAALVSRGPVWADSFPVGNRQAALVALINRMRRDHAAVIVTPDPVAGQDPLRDAPFLPLVTPMTVATVDLTGDTAARRSRLRGKWRNALVRAEASCLRIIAQHLPPIADHWLLRHEASQAQARGYRRLPAAFAVAWAHVSPENTLLMAAHDATGPLAGMLFLRHGTVASYHCGWTAPEGRSCGAHTRLMWAGMNRLADMGVTRLELDLIDTDNSPGIARFKLGTGAHALQLGATRIAAPGSHVVARIARARMWPATPQRRQAAELIP